MMRFVHVAVAVLSLLSVGQSAPVTSCESLIQPLEITGREQLLGKWIQIAESTNSRNARRIMEAFRESFWIKVTAGNKSDAFTLMGTSKAFGLCIAVEIKTILENSTLQPVLRQTDAASGTAAPSPLPHILNDEPALPPEDRAEAVITVTHAHFHPPEPRPAIALLKSSCSDCLVLQPPDNMFEGSRSLMLLSKRRKVTAAELEEFKKQADCLNLQQHFTLNPEADVCPEPPSQDTQNEDVLHVFLNGQKTDFEKLFENITSAVGGQEKFSKMLSELNYN